MRRLLALLLTFAVLFSFAGCQKEPAGETAGTTAPSSPTQTPTNPDPTDPTQPDPTTPTEKPVDEITPDNWGRSDRIAAGRGDSEVFYINFPKYTGYSEGYGFVAEQLDGTCVIVSGEGDDSPEINNVSELFPAYIGELQYTLEKIYGLRSSNWELTLTGNAPAKVGDYDMHTFTGTMSFDYLTKKGTTHRDYSFIAYATTLKSNGAYAYWVVYDISEDQSKGDLIEEHALNMAKTFREKE